MLLGCLTQKIQLNMKNKLTFTGCSFAEDSGLKCQAVILYEIIHQPLCFVDNLTLLRSHTMSPHSSATLLFKNIKQFR